MIQILDKTNINHIINIMVSGISSFETKNLCFIAILKGGVYIAQKISSYFSLDIHDTIIGYLGLSSYTDKTQTIGKIKITYPLDLSVGDLNRRNIWIIDDIFDSGLTMMYAKDIIKQIGGCNSIRTAVLVRKMKPNIELWKDDFNLPNIVGYEYNGSGFLIGSGMGMGEKYRCLSGLYELESGKNLKRLNK